VPDALLLTTFLSAAAPRKYAIANLRGHRTDAAAGRRFHHWLLARTISSLLFGVIATDPVTFLGMLVTLTAVAAIAGYVPARRASRIDPMLALRAN